jgi:hypothetical protein
MIRLDVSDPLRDVYQVEETMFAELRRFSRFIEGDGGGGGDGG